VGTYVDLVPAFSTPKTVKNDESCVSTRAYSPQREPAWSLTSLCAIEIALYNESTKRRPRAMGMKSATKSLPKGYDDTAGLGIDELVTAAAGR
jgi:hypothetical protein